MLENVWSCCYLTWVQLSAWLITQFSLVGFSITTETAFTWFAFYLSHRSFSVAIDRYVSSAVELTCGVPHSSGLGPKLLKSHLFHKHKLCLVMSLIIVILYLFNVCVVRHLLKDTLWIQFTYYSMTTMFWLQSNRVQTFRPMVSLISRVEAGVTCNLVWWEVIQ